MVRLTSLKPRTALVAALSTTLVAVGASTASAAPAAPRAVPHAALTAATRSASPRETPYSQLIGIYTDDIDCVIAGSIGQLYGEWNTWDCIPDDLDEGWYFLYVD
jgi:hypothetical protein